MGHAKTMADEDVRRQVANLKFAAEDGHAESMFLLGVAYAQGRGVEKSDSNAARWFHQAARKGHCRARTSMGYLYSIGRGVRHDLILAYLFIAQAMAEGDVLARDMMTKLRKQMNPAQIKEAERRMRERAI